MISTGRWVWSKCCRGWQGVDFLDKDIFFWTATDRCLREVDWYVDVLNCGQLGLGNGNARKRHAGCTVHGS